MKQKIFNTRKAEIMLCLVQDNRIIGSFPKVMAFQEIRNPQLADSSPVVSQSAICDSRLLGENNNLDKPLCILQERFHNMQRFSKLFSLDLIPFCVVTNIQVASVSPD